MPALAISISGSEIASDAPIANLITNTHNIAIKKLDAGPAAATHNMSFLGLRKRPKSTGTGFAQPNRMPPSKIVIAGNKIVPKGSMCLHAA